MKYNDENSLSCVITLCYLYARKDYRIEREEKSGKGYCDFMFYPRKDGITAIILELKADHTAEEAIAKIEEKRYVQKVEGYSSVLLVGIAYNRKKKVHRCVIKKYR